MNGPRLADPARARAAGPSRRAALAALALALALAALAVPGAAAQPGRAPGNYACTVTAPDVYAACSNTGTVTKTAAGQSIRLSQSTPARTCRHRFQTPGVNNAFEVLVSRHTFAEIGTTYMWAGYTYTHRVRCGPSYTGPVAGSIRIRGDV
jgi:hypothetical protein